MSERPSCPDMSCGLNIGVCSMKSLLESETERKRRGKGGHTVHIWSSLARAESGGKRRQIRRPFSPGSPQQSIGARLQDFRSSSVPVFVR